MASSLALIIILGLSADYLFRRIKLPGQSLGGFQKNRVDRDSFACRV